MAALVWQVARLVGWQILLTGLLTGLLTMICARLANKRHGGCENSECSRPCARRQLAPLGSTLNAPCPVSTRARLGQGSETGYRAGCEWWLPNEKMFQSRCMLLLRFAAPRCTAPAGGGSAALTFCRRMLTACPPSVGGPVTAVVTARLLQATPPIWADFPAQCAAWMGCSFATPSGE